MERPAAPTLEDVMKLLRSASGPQNDLDDAEPEDETEEPDADGDEEENTGQVDKESSDEDEFATNRLLNFVRAATNGNAKSSSQPDAQNSVPKPQGKTSSHKPLSGFASQASGPVPKSTAGPSTRFRAGSLGKSHASSQPPAKAQKGRQIGQKAMELDGRGVRMQEGLKVEITDIENNLDSLAAGLDSDGYSPFMTPPARKDFEIKLHAHQRSLAKLESRIVTSQARISKSTNKVMFCEEDELFAALKQKVNRLQNFLKQAALKHPVAHTFIIALDDCVQDEIHVPPPYFILWYISLAQQAMMQDRFENVLAMCFSSSDVFRRLTSNGVPEEELPQAAQKMFDNTVLEKLGTLSEAEAQSPMVECPKKVALRDIAVSSLKAFLYYCYGCC